MRLKKGINVEVFHSSETLPNGSWRPATILCGNGRNYSVKYDHDLSLNNVKIQRKFIRPSPLIKENSKPIKWAIGDISEVFIHGGWTNGKLTGVAFGNEFYFVSLIDYDREIAVKRDGLRLRRVWKNNKWILVKKDSERIEDIKKRKLADISMKKGDCESIGSCSTSGRPHNYNNITNNNINNNNISFPLEDDDAMSSCASTKRRKTENNNEMKDMESKEEEEKIHKLELESKEEKEKIHKLELDEYNATMNELYQNEFITWEQETMLANLRVFLNITQDEHRAVLKSLKP